MADMKEFHVQTKVSGCGWTGLIGVFKQRNSKFRVGLRNEGCAGLEQTRWRQARGEAISVI